MASPREILLIVTLVLSVTATFIALMAPLDPNQPLATALVAGALMLLAAYAYARKNTAAGPVLTLLLWIGLLGGLTLRALSFWPEAAVFMSLGFDLFSGQALLNGWNPYLFTADELLGGGLRVGDAALERARGGIAASPPLSEWLAQVAPTDARPSTPLLTLPFLALAQQLTPGGALGWYGILLISDLVTLGLLAVLLLRTGVALGWLLLFWLNPIWLTGVFAPAAPLALLGPVILLALWASISERAALLGLLLAVAAALNLWLAALLPLFLRSAGRRPLAWRRAAYGLVGFVLVFGMLLGLHLAFGAPLHWFGGLSVSGPAAGTSVGQLFAIDAEGLIGGLSRFAAVVWVMMLIASGLALAWPPLPDQAQRTIRAGLLGFLAFFLTTQMQPQGLLVLVIVLPLARSPALVLAAGFGTLVTALSSLSPALAGLSPEMTARLGVGLVLIALFVFAWFTSVRRDQALE